MPSARECCTEREVRLAGYQHVHAGLDDFLAAFGEFLSPGDEDGDFDALLRASA